MPEPTIGERRVRTSFNPSQDDTVSQIKQKTAELINICEVHKAELFNEQSANPPSEKIRLIALAQTSYEEAAMWAVKAATAE